MTAERTVQLVILLVGLCALVGSVATAVLIWNGKNADSLAGFATAALGGLVGILASTRSTPTPPPEEPKK